MAEAFFAYYRKQQLLERREAKAREKKEEQEAKERAKKEKQEARERAKKELAEAKERAKKEQEEEDATIREEEEQEGGGKKREDEEQAKILKIEKQERANAKKREKRKQARAKKRELEEQEKERPKNNPGERASTSTDPSTAEFLRYIEEQVKLEPLPTKLRPSGATADWDDFLKDAEHLHYIPPVHFFKHAPLANVWKEFAKVGLVVEAPNPHVVCKRPVNWYAKVVHFTGYYALIKFEGLGIENQFAGWMSFCSAVPKPIGYSDRSRILLHPPYEVRQKFPDCFQKAKALHRNSATIAEDHAEFVVKEIEKHQIYKVGDFLEAMDREEIHRMKIGKVATVVGDRIHVVYVIESDPDDPSPGFWFSVKSSDIHPLGWSHTVGHEIFGLPVESPFNPLPDDFFTEFPEIARPKNGQLFETRHPTMPYLICVAKIILVLKHGYFVFEVITRRSEKKYPICYTYHVLSPYALPVGFCEFMKIDLIPRYESDDQNPFSWDEYLEENEEDCVAPFRFLPKRPNHNFKPGMKLETADAMNPAYIGPSTVRRVRGHLLYVSFDGWPKNMTDPPELWIDADSPDIYPVGYCGLVNHEFNGQAEPPSLREADFPKDD